MADDERKLTANITPFGLRMQPELKSRVEAAARDNNRSMNAEIVERLETSFNNRASEQIEALKRLVASLNELTEATEASRVASVNALTHELENTREALNEQKGITAAMHELLAMSSRDASTEHQEREAISAKIGDEVTDMLDQRRLLEGLKEELHQLLEERGSIASGERQLIDEQSALIEKMGTDLRENSKLLELFRDAFLNAAEGDDKILTTIRAQFGPPKK